MTFCGNLVELIEKKKVYKDSDFLRWENTNLTQILRDKVDIEVYIEKQLINELNEKPMVIIDAAIGQTGEGEIGMLFIKKEQNVYG